MFIVFGHKEVVELLIAKGADVNARGFLGITLLDQAVGNTFNDKNNTEVANLLRQQQPSRNFLSI